MKNFLAPATSILLLAGCVTTQPVSQSSPSEQPATASPTLADRMNASIATITQAIVANPVKANGASASAVQDGRTHLSNLNIKNVIANSNSADWPRIAITINKLPKWFYGVPPSGTPGRYSPGDCITISLTVWSDQKSSTTYDNVDVCGNDIVKNVPFKDVGMIWKNFASASGKQNTGIQRTRGPLPPLQLFPNKPGLDLFFQMNGSYYVGSIMSILGYNWKETEDTRLWFVNVPTQADVAGQ